MAYMKDSTGRRLDSFEVGPLVRGGTFAVIGDSIAAASTNGNQGRQGYAWHSRLPMILGQRTRRVAVFATAGYTLEQIRDNHLPQVLAMNPRPDMCVIAGGTNNVSTPGPQWTALLDIIASLKAAGIRPVLWVIPPRADAIAAVAAWNAKVRALAVVNRYQVVDAYSPMIDPATGSYISGYESDSPAIHPTRRSHYRIAAYNAPAWAAPQGSPAPYLTAGAGDLTNLIDSNRGLFLTDNDSNGLSDGWSVGAAGTGSYTRNVDADGYTWQRIVKTSGGARSVFRLVTSGFSAGDRLALSSLFESSSVDIAATVQALPRTSGVVNADETTWVQACVSVLGGIVTSQVIYGENIVPAGTTDYQVVIQVDSDAVAGSSYIGVARLGLFNLTTMGL